MGQQRSTQHCWRPEALTKLVFQSGTVYNSIGHIKRSESEEKDEDTTESEGFSSMSVVELETRGDGPPQRRVRKLPLRSPLTKGTLPHADVTCLAASGRMGANTTRDVAQRVGPD